MPWVVPSHQAPAVLLKRWRPHWFSGFGLVLGTIAPDLEFIFRLDGAWFVSHTVLGQLYFTVPVVLLFYVLSVDLVIPWLLPYLPAGAPFHWHELALLRRPRGLRGWMRVAFSGFVGGLTHIFLDGFTHGDRSGWAVARIPLLRARVPGLGAPVYDVLQLALTVLLAVVAFWGWGRLVQEKGFAAPEDPLVARASRRSRVELARWLGGCVLAGVVTALGFRPQPSVGLAFERGVYGALTFFVFGLVLAALGERLVGIPGRPSRARARFGTSGLALGRSPLQT
jgi:hypothetical protein